MSTWLLAALFESVAFGMAPKSPEPSPLKILLDITLRNVIRCVVYLVN